MVSVDVKHHVYLAQKLCESRSGSWAPIPNKPTVSVDVKQHSTNQLIQNHMLRQQKIARAKSSQSINTNYQDRQYGRTDDGTETLHCCLIESV